MMIMMASVAMFGGSMVVMCWICSCTCLGSVGGILMKSCIHLYPLIFNFADSLHTLETNGNYVFEVCFGEYMFPFNNLAWWFILYLGYLLTALVSRMIFQL